MSSPPARPTAGPPRRHHRRRPRPLGLHQHPHPVDGRQSVRSAHGLAPSFPGNRVHARRPTAARCTSGHPCRPIVRRWRSCFPRSPPRTRFFPFNSTERHVRMRRELLDWHIRPRRDRHRSRRRRSRRHLLHPDPRRQGRQDSSHLDLNPATDASAEGVKQISSARRPLGHDPSRSVSEVPRRGRCSLIQPTSSIRRAERGTAQQDHDDWPTSLRRGTVPVHGGFLRVEVARNAGRMEPRMPPARAWRSGRERASTSRSTGGCASRADAGQTAPRSPAPRRR